MATDCRNYPNTGSTPTKIQLPNDFKNEVQADVGDLKLRGAYVRLPGGCMPCSRLGGYLRRDLKLRGYVEVQHHGENWYSAKFSCKWDCDQALRASRWWLFNQYFIQIYRWVPNFVFSEAVRPDLHAGDIVKGCIKGLGKEYMKGKVLTAIVDAVFEPLSCPVVRVDTSLKGELPQFYFRYSGGHLPPQIQVDEAPPLRLSYSRAQCCFKCGDYGHKKWICPGLNPETRQRTRSMDRDGLSSSGCARIPVHQHPNVYSESPALFSDGTGAGLQTGSHPRHQIRSLNRDDPSSSGSGQIEVHHRVNVDSESFPISDSRDLSSDLPPPASFPDGTRADPQTGSHQGTLEQRSPPEHYEETNTVAPIHVSNGIPRSSGTTSPTRTTVEMKMPAKGAIFFENVGQRRSTLYILEEEVSEIGVTAELRGNLQQLTMIPHIGGATTKCTKKVICTSIDGVDATRTLEGICHDKGASLVVVFYESSVLVNHDQIVRRLGFSAFLHAEMTSQRVGANGSALSMTGNCLLMWKKKEVRVEISDVNMESSFQHLKFSASWEIGESNREEPDGLSQGVIACAVEGPSDSSDFTTFDSSQESDSKESSSSSTSAGKGSSNYSDSSHSTTVGSSDESGPEGLSSDPTAPKELPSGSGDVLPIRTPDGDTLSSDYRDASSLHLTFGEARSYETSTSSNSTSESSYSTLAVYGESPQCSPDSNTLPFDYGDADAEGSSGDETSDESDREGSSGDETSDESDREGSSGDEMSDASDREGSSGDEMSDASDWEGSSGDEMSDGSDLDEHFTDAVEISVGSSAPSSPSSNYESDASADSTSYSAGYTFFTSDEDETDSEGSTQYHSAAEEI